MGSTEVYRPCTCDLPVLLVHTEPGPFYASIYSFINVDWLTVLGASPLGSGSSSQVLVVLYDDQNLQVFFRMLRDFVRLFL